MRWTFLLAFAAGVVCAPARAEEPQDVTGVEREESKPGDVGRKIGSGLLFLPRAATELLFTATGTAAGLIEQEQVVPRINELLHPPPGEIHVFPTAFAETGNGANVGARAIARVDNLATTVRVGFGGEHDLVAESRMRLSFPKPLPLVFGIESLHDERSAVGFAGLGQEPESDPRNRFLPGAPSRSASYRERRGRFIGSLGLRPFSDVELFLSTGVSLRHALDPPDASANTISEVFEPGSVPGAYDTTRVVYSELALRVDSRRLRGEPVAGYLFEGYLGRGRGFQGTEAHFNRAGGRAAAFFSILERSNVLSPKIVIDGLAPIDASVPFVELPRQPDFRGFDNRRDFVSVVGSLDYRWTLMRYLGARLFGDTATVAPRVKALTLDGLRWDAGFGLDVFSRSTQLGSIAFSGSPDGVRFFFLFGIQSGFGDRQHRS
jgi:hypothetical protein